MIAVLNMGLLALNTIKSGVMNDFLNSKKQIKSILFQMFLSICRDFYSSWKKSKKEFNHFQMYMETVMSVKVKSKWRTYVKEKQI